MKTADNLDPYRKLPFVESRIPALDALTAFVAEGQEEDPAVQQATKRAGSSRWYPVAGGHKLLVPYEGGEYDAERFKIEKGAWNHEHCKACGANIEPMTLCWVTESGCYILLCNACHGRLQE